jgi:hypothetical protein
MNPALSSPELPVPALKRDSSLKVRRTLPKKGYDVMVLPLVCMHDTAEDC